MKGDAASALALAATSTIAVRISVAVPPSLPGRVVTHLFPVPIAPVSMSKAKHHKCESYLYAVRMWRVHQLTGVAAAGYWRHPPRPCA